MEKENPETKKWKSRYRPNDIPAENIDVSLFVHKGPFPLYTELRQKESKGTE